MNSKGGDWWRVPETQACRASPSGRVLDGCPLAAGKRGDLPVLLSIHLVSSSSHTGMSTPCTGDRKRQCTEEWWAALAVVPKLQATASKCTIVNSQRCHWISPVYPSSSCLFWKIFCNLRWWYLGEPGRSSSVGTVNHGKWESLGYGVRCISSYHQFIWHQNILGWSCEQGNYNGIRKAKRGDIYPGILQFL